MRKLAELFALLALLALPVKAQDTQTPQGEQPPTAPTDESTPAKVKHSYPTPRGEISAGFVYRNYYGGSATTIGMIGGYGSYTYDFFRWLALEGEFTGTSGTLKLPNLPPESLHVFTALAGPKIYPLGHHRLDPFAHADFGAGILTSSVPEFAGYPGNSGAKAVHAWQVGAGLELSLRSHLAVRVVQLDYVSAKFLGDNVPNQNSKRVSFGIVYRFGER